MSDYLRMFGAYSKDRELLLSSSSGGMFMTLARAAIRRGDAVICALMDVDTKSVVFKLIENESDLCSAQGSKYVQSLPGTVLHDAKSWLKRHPDKRILCFGMGCQMAGFRSFFVGSGLSDRVVLVDIICHGSPSPKLFRDYLHRVEHKAGGSVGNVSMRDKRNGWHHPYAYALVDGREILISSYLTLFYGNWALRPSCYSCPYSKLDRQSDLTIGDFWGIEKRFPGKFSTNGNSLVLVHSGKGMDAFSEVLNELEWFEFSEREDALQPNLVSPTIEPRQRKTYWLIYSNLGVWAVLFSMRLRGKIGAMYHKTMPVLRKISQPVSYRGGVRLPEAIDYEEAA